MLVDGAYFFCEDLCLFNWLTRWVFKFYELRPSFWTFFSICFVKKFLFLADWGWIDFWVKLERPFSFWFFYIHYNYLILSRFGAFLCGILVLLRLPVFFDAPNLTGASDAVGSSGLAFGLRFAVRLTRLLSNTGAPFYSGWFSFTDVRNFEFTVFFYKLLSLIVKIRKL